MSHENLIVTLAAGVEPVRPLPRPTAKLARWVVVAALAIGAGIAVRGLRTNWPAALADPTFVVTSALILMVALIAAWTTFNLSIPGALQTPMAKWLPVAFVFGSLAVRR